MAFELLSEREQGLVLACMKAVLEGPYISDAGVETRLGLDREALSAVVQSWPHLNDVGDDSPVVLAINGCMNEVINGIGLTPSEWALWSPEPKAEAARVFRRWRELKGFKPA